MNIFVLETTTIKTNRTKRHAITNNKTEGNILLVWI